jgi:Flp pilus assembly protein TadD
LSKGAEAVAAARRACELDRDDAGLIANLALSYLIDGRIEAASTAIGTARERDPQDPITEYLARLIWAVERHEIKAPTRWPPDEEGPRSRT